MDTVDTNYLTNFGYTREEVLAENDVEFNSLEEMGTKHEELNLGDIMSDAYVYAVEHSEESIMEPGGCSGCAKRNWVRDTYTKGQYYRRGCLQFIFTWNWQRRTGRISL